MELGEIRNAAASAAAEVLEAARLAPGDLFVVGCSSSEVMGEKIGTHTNTDIAGALYEGIMSVLEPAGIRLAAQCCEHLNRALVVEQETADAFRLEEVNAIPQPNHAGGAFATVAYERMAHPIVVEDLGAQASAGICRHGHRRHAHRHAYPPGSRPAAHLRRSYRGSAPHLCPPPAQICGRRQSHL